MHAGELFFAIYGGSARLAGPGLPRFWGRRGELAVVVAAWWVVPLMRLIVKGSSAATRIILRMYENENEMCTALR